MSTKIYYAWTWPVRSHRHALAAFREFALADAAARVKKVVARVNRAAFEKAARAFARKRKTTLTREMTRDLTVKFTMELAAGCSASPYRAQVLDLDASLTLFFVAPDVFAVGFGECWDRLPDPPALPFPDVPTVEDFAYWNNTDKPAHLTDRQWEARGRIWDGFLDRWSAERMTHTIISGKDEQGFEEVVRRVRPRGNVYRMLP